MDECVGKKRRVRGKKKQKIIGNTLQLHDGLSSGVRVSVAVLSSSFFDVDGFSSGNFGPRSSPFSFKSLLFDRDQQNERDIQARAVRIAHTHPFPTVNYLFCFFLPD